jgi:spore maturation protein CgeB
MKRICIYDTAVHGEFHGYWVESPLRQMNLSGLGHRTWQNLLANGRNGYIRDNALWFQQFVDEMYRDRDPAYMRLVEEFIARYADFDVLVFGIQCFIHPEILATRLTRPVKILGFVDDPVSTYAHGVPCLWAFDGAFYITPAYSDAMSMDELLARAGCRHRFWLPLTPPVLRPEIVDEAFFAQRNIPMVYVGKRYTHKVDRLARLKRHFGDALQVYGRWPLKGWWGPARTLTGDFRFPYRVHALTHDERTALYWRTKIGFNMHWSRFRMETGNMRMYETPLHGMMLLCDQAARGLHAQIFEPDREAVYYDTIEDAIEKAEYYLAHEDERIEIARGGFERAWKDYNWEKVFARFLDWAAGIKDTAGSARSGTPATCADAEGSAEAGAEK